MADAIHDHVLGMGVPADAIAREYVGKLAEHGVDAIRTSEPQDLSQTAHSLLLSIQALSKRSHRAIVDSSTKHAALRTSLPALAHRAGELRQAVPKLDGEAELFSKKFGKSSENDVLARRKKALRLLRNAERLVDVMELPTLLSTSINTSPVSYSSSLDLYAHVRRLASLYPHSPLVVSVMSETDTAIRQMASDLIVGLKAPNLKLAAALRSVGWLKRIVPELVPRIPTEDALPAIFLVCRFTTLITTLEALEPLKQLADEEQVRNSKAAQSWSGGQHTERYLKRFIEVFREHSFGIISVSKSVDASFSHSPQNNMIADAMRPLPSVLATFPLHLINILTHTLQKYLPNLHDQAARESILTQVLYCAGSLGRLGADFGMLLPAVAGNEWIELVKRHRLLAGRLESVLGDYRSSPPTAAAK